MFYYYGLFIFETAFCNNAVFYFSKYGHFFYVHYDTALLPYQ